MPDKSLEQALILIRQKQYAQARALLQRSDSPEAADWLRVIQCIESSDTRTVAATLGLIFTLITITTGIIFSGVAYFVFLRFLKRQQNATKR